MQDVQFKGQTKSISGWAQELGISRERMRMRLKTLPLEEALTTPKGQVSKEGQKRMLSARKERMTLPDTLLDKAKQAAHGQPENRCLGVLLKQGVDFDGDTERVRSQVITRASARGEQATTRMNDEKSFWLFVFQN